MNDRSSSGWRCSAGRASVAVEGGIARPNTRWRIRRRPGWRPRVSEDPLTVLDQIEARLYVAEADKHGRGGSSGIDHLGW